MKNKTYTVSPYQALRIRYNEAVRQAAVLREELAAQKIHAKTGWEQADRWESAARSLAALICNK